MKKVPGFKFDCCGNVLKALRAGRHGVFAVLVITCASLQAHAQALTQTENLNAWLGERIEFVKKGVGLSVGLQVTVFQPEGAGPFPVVVINHGKERGDSHSQVRYRPITAAREFLQRGYAVVVPMLQGFAGSGGSFTDHGCNTEANGDAQTEDLGAVVDWLKTQHWADTSRMVMTGQSFGGLVTIAYSQYADPGFKLFVNFAGGLRYALDCKWETRLLEAFESYGRTSRAPSLWFYGENDSYFPPQPVSIAFQAFEKAGGNGEMVAYGPFGVDAHAMFGDVDGADIWLDRVLLRMKRQGLPVEINLAQYGRVGVKPIASGYAEITDINALGLANAGSQNAYSVFLQKRLPRAFVIAPKAQNQTYSWGGDNPVSRALEVCEKTNGETCLLYAVDDTVTWQMP